jgi:hypothetical protein
MAEEEEDGKRFERLHNKSSTKADARWFAKTYGAGLILKGILDAGDQPLETREAAGMELVREYVLHDDAGGCIAISRNRDSPDSVEWNTKDYPEKVRIAAGVKAAGIWVKNTTGYICISPWIMKSGDKELPPEVRAAFKKGFEEVSAERHRSLRMEMGEERLFQAVSKIGGGGILSQGKVKPPVADAANAQRNGQVKIRPLQNKIRP